MPNILVFDIGKTHIKLHLLDARYQTLAVRETCNKPVEAGPYPAADVDGMWHWFVENARVLQAEFGIGRINVTTHGATAALINRQRAGNGLVLPVLDYEYAGIESLDSDYNRVRPEFAESGSPALPAGLNLGRQLFWLSRQYPGEFADTTDILMYPQYWVWRLTGQCYSEVTSLGCHTDLWAPWQKQYSSLVNTLQWVKKFPPLAPAWAEAGTLLQSVCDMTGLSPECIVHVGVHDSNASYVRYRRALADESFSVVSTGTWSIVMNGGADVAVLKANRDMLANVDVTGTPVICSRFMGGREYALVCQQLGGALGQAIDAAHINALIAAGVYCLPGWQAGTGPFAGMPGEIRGTLPADVPAAALASLYCALVLDYQLDLVAAHDQVIIGGAFLKNPLLCGLLARLREGQSVLACRDITGTVMGAAQLTHWQEENDNLHLDAVLPAEVDGLDDYRCRWRDRIAARDWDRG